MKKTLLFLCPLALLLFAACNNQQQTATAPPANNSNKATAASPAPSAQSKTVATPTGEMALIPAGQFTMGDDSAESTDEKPAHNVSVAAFYMDTREVTQKQYEALVKQNPSKYKGPDRPIEQVDWYHAALYCNARSRKENLKPCYDPKTLACDFSANGYRLPTEAEWEYACRAGSTTKYSFGDDSSVLKTYAWFKTNSNKASHPVGQKSPNAFGLYDMHGNVAEWCQDVYSDAYYQQKVAADPQGPATGDKRVLRGGGWSANDDACRSTARNSENARFADACFGSDAYGFRCVRKAMQ